MLTGFRRQKELIDKIHKKTAQELNAGDINCGTASGRSADYDPQKCMRVVLILEGIRRKYSGI